MLTARDRDTTDKMKQYQDATLEHIAATQRIAELTNILQHNLAQIEWAFIQNSMRMKAADIEQIDKRELTELLEESDNFKLMLTYIDENVTYIIRRCKFEEMEISNIHC